MLTGQGKNVVKMNKVTGKIKSEWQTMNFNNRLFTLFTSTNKKVTIFSRCTILLYSICLVSTYYNLTNKYKIS